MRALIDLARAMTPRERRQLAWITAGLCLAALLEVAGVASVVPFLTLVGDPAAVGRLPLLGAAKAWLGVSDRAFLAVVGFAALGAILATSLVNAGLTFAQLRFTNLAGYALSRRLLARYLARDRLFFANRNSAELAKNVLAEADRVVVGVLTPVTVMVARGLAAAAIVAFLVAVEPRLALLLGAGFGGLYVLVYAVTRHHLARIGAAATKDNERRFALVAECFGALTELKLYGRIDAFAGRFDRPARAYALANAASLTLGQVPRFAVEALAFGGVIAVVLAALSRGLDPAGLLPLLGLFAFAGYRLLPAFQHLFNSLSTLRFHLPIARLIVAELDGPAPRAAGPAPAPLPFAHEIRFEGVTFAYSGDARPQLRGLDLAIPARGWIGLAGRTGAGKSTLVGLLLGLLAPNGGRITVDGVPLDGTTIRAWQARVGYVPQDVFLVDDTIAANIALGVDAAAVDHAAVERAARLAAVHEFVAALPQGYATLVGERGGRLSGGQRQRLGIARALYHDPDVVVLDEATSALDAETEAAVVAALHALAATRTVVTIAHRPAALARADVIHVLEDGRLARSVRPEAA